VFNCAPHTVQSCALEHQLAEPGPPVFVRDNGTNTHIYTYEARATTRLDDAELDGIVTYILEVFPAFGSHMIEGHLKYLGHQIPRLRVQTAY
jgi:hypothetical protein